MTMQDQSGTTAASEGDWRLTDVRSVFRRNAVLSAFVTLSGMVVAMASVELGGQRLQQSIVLSLQPSPTASFLLIPEPSRSSSFLAPISQLERIAALATESVRRERLEPRGMTADYNPESHLLRLTVRATDKGGLAQVSREATALLQARLRDLLSGQVPPLLASATAAVSRERRIVEDLDAQLVAAKAKDRGRRDAIEGERARRVANLTGFEYDRQSLERVQEDPAAVVLKVVSQSPPMVARSRLRAAVIGFLFGCLASIVLVLVREQLRRDPERSQGPSDGQTGTA